MKARLFRHDVPCDADIASHKGHQGTFGMAAYHLDKTSLNNVIIVYNGVAWRPLRKKFHTQGRNIILECVPLNNTPYVQELLLADMILG